MDTACIFCKIIAGELPAKKIYEDDEIVAFHDIHPKAAVHLLVVPKKHIPTLTALTHAESALISRLVLTLPTIAQQQNLTDFRLVVNNGPDSGQIIYHLHLHILGGKKMPGF